MKSPVRWKQAFPGVLLTLAHLSHVVHGQSPTPPPSLFAGYDYGQCVIDVFQSDVNGDGFISRNEQEYRFLINRIGANFCYEHKGDLTAEHQSAYFRLVCDIVPDCRFTSEIPIGSLTRDQIIKICEETRASIYTTCPSSPTSPVAPSPVVFPNPTVPAPTLPPAPRPTRPIPTPPPMAPTNRPPVPSPSPVAPPVRN